ncbi:MAG TPA: DUF192 domain-containing protein [Syntrophales bacterium]|nr:DUF192 domain-containing protein [Syntrophales bacterium]
MNKPDLPMPAAREKGVPPAEAGRGHAFRPRSLAAALAGLLILIGAPVPRAEADGAVSVRGRVFSAEVARTPQEKAKGLMFRKALARDACMFFLYDEDSHHAIWMKNCFLPLDVVWVDGEGRVVEVAENVPPCAAAAEACPSYGGKVLSRHFVEFPAGTVAAVGVLPGEEIGWDLSVAGEGRWINTPDDGIPPSFLPAAP